MLYSMKQLLKNAEENKYAIGYFEAFNMDSMLAVLKAAEKKSSPVILGFGGQFLSSKKRDVKENIYHYATLAYEVATNTSIPCAIILNEANEIDMVYRAMKAGFNTVMYQKPGEDFEETVKITKEICKIAHYLNIEVESEVGELPSASISTNSVTQGSLTSIDKAQYFVEETNIDALAVAIGNVHLLEGNQKASLDFDLLDKLRKKIDVPLVLHGGTGVSEEDLKKAISIGISKVNVGTVLKREYINAIKSYYSSKDVSTTDPHEIIGWGGAEDILEVGKTAISRKVMGFLDVLGSSDKAILFTK